ncbi:hypothetical protein P5673_023138 [Acropora cervicornis]|uniref:Uncharacterized protein n=1 Tax=Acropora cervicornis TaxID=6130 RepID=A0AAD9Q5T7_ACRCE|nr:hypothetical protein P5673_023138 [Acropora cervicornis]
MGVLEDMKCLTVLKRGKDLKYHIKDCQEYECDIPGFGKLFNQKRQGTRTSSVSNVLNVKISSEVIKTDVTRFKCIVEDAERAPTLFENFKIPLARFGSFVFLSFYIICSEDFLSASAAKSMHASSSKHEGELLGWIAGSFSEHNSGISVSPDVGAGKKIVFDALPDKMKTFLQRETSDTVLKPWKHCYQIYKIVNNWPPEHNPKDFFIQAKE